MGAVKLGLFLKDFQDNGGAAQGDKETYEHGLIERAAQSGGDGEAHQKGQDQLERTAQNHRLLHAHELFQRKFNADGEQQQHDTNFGEDFHFLYGADQPKSIRPGENSRQEKAHNGGQVEALTNQKHTDGQGEYDKNIFK